MLRSPDGASGLFLANPGRDYRATMTVPNHGCPLAQAPWLNELSMTDAELPQESAG